MASVDTTCWGRLLFNMSILRKKPFKIYYLYKIILHGHKINYFGVTNNFLKRKLAHRAEVRKILFCLLNRVPYGKRQVVHIELATIIYNTTKKTQDLRNPILPTCLKISIIDILDTPEQAKVAETKTIRSCKHGKNVNILKTSSFFDKDFDRNQKVSI